MDGTLGNLKVWKCGKGHVLGLVRRDRNKTKEQREFWVSRLMLFRQALDETEDVEKGDVIALIEGLIETVPSKRGDDFNGGKNDDLGPLFPELLRESGGLLAGPCNEDLFPVERRFIVVRWSHVL